jgi:ribosomal protein L3
MSLGLVGTKCGMSRLFQETGDSTPVTLIYIDNNIFI